MTRPVVVFDTNILFSAIGWHGKPHQCVALARAGLVQGVSCREILEELADKLGSKLDFSTEQVSDAVAELAAFLTLVTITGDLRAVAADAKDDMVVECAVAAGADFILSGDRRHLLPIKFLQGIRIVGVDEFLTAVME